MFFFNISYPRAHMQEHRSPEAPVTPREHADELRMSLPWGSQPMMHVSPSFVVPSRRNLNPDQWEDTSTTFTAHGPTRSRATGESLTPRGGWGSRRLEGGPRQSRDRVDLVDMTAVWPTQKGTKNSRTGISTRMPQAPEYHTPSMVMPPNTEGCVKFGPDTTDHVFCNSNATPEGMLGWARSGTWSRVEYILPQKEAESESAVETVLLLTTAAEKVASQGEERPARAGDSCTQIVTQRTRGVTVDTTEFLHAHNYTP